MAGVHRLEHVERFFASDFADDDAIGPHTEGVDDQVPLLHGTFAFNVGRPGFEPDDVALAQIELSGVFDRDHTFVLADEARKDIEQRRLAGAGAT